MELELDVSTLEPPEPFERILDALIDLKHGDWLRVHHRREPFPLYDVLRRGGYCWRTERLGDSVDILIWPAASLPPGGTLSPAC